jgi:short-subunit dehydrogenase
MEEPRISVTIACPGFVKTTFHEKVLTPGEEEVKRHSGGFMTSRTAAQMIVAAAAGRERLLVMTKGYGSLIGP